MNKKTIAIIVTILIVALVGFITIKIATDYSKEAKLRNEVKEIIKYLNSDNPNTDKLNEILDRTKVKKGDYNQVETSIKSYYKKISQDISNLNFLTNEENYNNYLTGNNLLDDRPNFINSKNNLENTKNQLEDQYNELILELTDETRKMSYIADKDIKNYYKDFYLELINEINTEEFKETKKLEKETTINKIETFNKALDFLIVNKGHWDVTNDVIVFDKTTLYEEYIRITDELKEVN